MEQVAAGVWRDAIEDVVEAAVQDVTARGVPRGQGHQAPMEGQPGVPDDDAETPQLEPHQQYGLPPLQPRELVQAATTAPLVESAVPSTPASLMSSMPRVGTPAPGTPVGGLLRRPQGHGSRMDEALRRAQVLSGHASAPATPSSEGEGLGGHKRVAEMSLEQLQEAAAATPRMEGTAPSANTFEATEMNIEDGGEHHPLRKLCELVAEDRKNPEEAEVHDHGTWKGTWPLPSRSQWQAVKAVDGKWPNGEHDAMAAQTARREYK